MSEKKKQNVIYHYCSLEAFHSIITKKSFWLFSLSSSNDLDELNGAKKTLDKILNKEEYKNIIKQDKNKNDEFYSLSCTHKGDSALHFNKYADNDKGICFGINTDVFKKHLKNTLSNNIYLGYFFFARVIYNDNKKENMIKKYLDERVSYMEQPEKAKAKEPYEMFADISSEQSKDVLRNLAYPMALSHFKPILKTKNYEDEAETRILFWRNQFQLYKKTYEKANFYNTWLEPAKKLKLDNLPKFKPISGTIRKYMELEMGVIWDQQPIKEVILGPNCKTDIKEFNEFLQLNGVKCEAVNSRMKNRK